MITPKQIHVDLNHSAKEVRNLAEDCKTTEKNVLKNAVENEQNLYDFYINNNMPVTASTIKSLFENGAINSSNPEYELKIAFKEIENSEFKKKIQAHLSKWDTVKGVGKEKSIREISQRDISDSMDYLEAEGFSVYDIFNEKLGNRDYNGIVEDANDLLDDSYIDYFYNRGALERLSFLIGKTKPEDIKKEYDEFRKNVRKIKSAARYLDNVSFRRDPTGLMESAYTLENLDDEKYEELMGVIKSLVGKNDQFVIVKFDYEKLVPHGSDVIGIGAKDICVRYISEISKKGQESRLSDDYNKVAPLLEHAYYNEVLK